MTKVTVYKTRDNSYTGFTLEGHAGYDKHSKDIVCASISVLTINTINSIEQFTSDLPLVDMEDEKNGILKCWFHGNISKETILLIDSMLLGLTELKKQYGKKFIDIKFQEV